MKLATPQIRELPAANRSSSRPTSKSSRCTRIMALAPGNRREDGDLVAFSHWVLESDIVMVDRDTDDREIAQCLGISAAARSEPVEEAGYVPYFRRRFDLLLGAADTCPQPGKIQKLHPITSA